MGGLLLQEYVVKISALNRHSRQDEARGGEFGHTSPRRGQSPCSGHSRMGTRARTRAYSIAEQTKETAWNAHWLSSSQMVYRED
jgi:hypothetical protein